MRDDVGHQVIWVFVLFWAIVFVFVALWEWRSLRRSGRKGTAFPYQHLLMNVPAPIAKPPKATRMYTFTFLMQRYFTDEEFDVALIKLLSACGEDIFVYAGNGVFSVEFEREATSLWAATARARRELARAGFDSVELSGD